MSLRESLTSSFDKSRSLADQKLKLRILKDSPYADSLTPTQETVLKVHYWLEGKIWLTVCPFLLLLLLFSF